MFYIDSSWRERSLQQQQLERQRQLRDQSREQQQQQPDVEYRDESSPTATAAEQSRIQAQEMAAYHKRLASLSLTEAQRLTQIDLKHSDSHVTAQVGHPAYLKCAVNNLGDQLVRESSSYNRRKNSISSCRNAFHYYRGWNFNSLSNVFLQVSWARRRDWHILTSGIA